MPTPTVYGVGYLGVGPHVACIGRKPTKLYSLWANMLKRCYGDYADSRSTYADVRVCKRWHNFQNFARDVKALPNCLKPGFHFDKDLIKRGNREYSPNRCSFVPKLVNSFTANMRIDGEVGVGIKLDRRNTRRPYVAQSNQHGKLRFHGNYATEAEALTAYRQARNLYARELAHLHKGVLHPAVYRTLTNWRER